MLDNNNSNNDNNRVSGFAATPNPAPVDTMRHKTSLNPSISITPKYIVLYKPLYTEISLHCQRSPQNCLGIQCETANPLISR